MLRIMSFQQSQEHFFSYFLSFLYLYHPKLQLANPEIQYNPTIFYQYQLLTLEQRKSTNDTDIMGIPKIVYFFAYSYSFVLYGSIITGMGPIIPYFAAATGNSETSFSYIFFVRALGYLVGGSLIKVLTQHFSTHKILIGIELVGGLSLIGSSLSLSTINLAVCMFVSAACCCMINVVSNMCILKLYAGDNQDFWVQLLHLIFGAGGLVGPFIIIKFHEHSFFVLGLLFLSCIPIFYLLKAPEARDSVRKSEMCEPISRKAQILTCILYLFYIGEQVGFGSWIPTYAVVQKITSPQGASVLGSLFWISNTTFRIILLYVRGKISDRLKVLLAGMIGTSLFMLGTALGGEKYWAAYGGVFLTGMFLASMFALFITLPGEFNFKVTNSNTANFMMCASMGEGALTMPIGYAMGLFGPNMLFVLMLLFSLIMYYVFKDLMATYEEDAKNHSPINERLIEDNESQTSQLMKPF